ncbi:MAG: hypothetical protein RRY79_03825 [Clostridia bacterium]
MKLSSTKKLTLGAMVVTLTVLSLYLTVAIPYVKMACLFISSLFVFILADEGAYLSAVLSYLAATAIAFFIIPDKLIWAAYAILCGHFGIFKTFLGTKLKDPVIGFALRLLYCNVFLGIGIAVAIYIIGFDIGTLNLTIPLWAILIVLEIALVAFDILYSFMQKIYIFRFKNLLISKR